MGDLEDYLRKRANGSLMSVSVGNLFSGIGGFELGFDRALLDLRFSCEIDSDCSDVLDAHFPHVANLGDLFSLHELPAVEVLTAGFPCQSFSQAGKANGLESATGKLVPKMLELLGNMKPLPEWLVLENVPFILSVDGGAAVALIIDTIEALGYQWSYRIVDCKTFGTPQRRRRWILVATQNGDPRFLFKQPLKTHEDREASAFGFYWTEGNRGLGWAPDAIPPLKVGSAYGIPSTPAFWHVSESSFYTPTLQDAERLQGFPQHWTDVRGIKRGARLRLIGNAVNPLLAKWLADSIRENLPASTAKQISRLDTASRLPPAAYGSKYGRYQIECGDRILDAPPPPLLDFLATPASPLSKKAAAGFLGRARRSSLRFAPRFLDDLEQYINEVEKSDNVA